MIRFFVDTNLFIRYLTNDDPAKADRVEQLLEKAAAGQIALVTAEMVVAEIVWVLESAYGLKPKEITPLIRSILATPGLEVLNGHLVEKGLEYYQTQNVDFIDGYIAAVMAKHNLRGLYSFDQKHISRIPGIERKEP